MSLPVIESVKVSALAGRHAISIVAQIAADNFHFIDQLP
jgi:hypothetical protein